tara:strand:- start:107 stop:295 length:189 start_codon:yes stop_codon:yes gene_type:complete
VVVEVVEAVEAVEAVAVMVEVVLLEDLYWNQNDIYNLLVYQYLIQLILLYIINFGNQKYYKK